MKDYYGTKYGVKPYTTVTVKDGYLGRTVKLHLHENLKGEIIASYPLGFFTYADNKEQAYERANS